MTQRPLHSNSASTAFGDYRFILLRHAESIGNVEDRVQGHADYPLTETGKQQADALAKRWLAEGLTFDRIISSPQTRSRQTAEIIAGLLGAPLEFDPLWMERDYGRVSGMQSEEAIRTEGRPLYDNPYMPVGETGESLWDLYLRGGQAVSSLLKLPSGCYLVVSHGGILNMVLYAIFGIAPQPSFGGARFRFRNTAFATLTYIVSEHIWRLEGMNDRAHWKDHN